METMNPRLTIQNIDSASLPGAENVPVWQVRMEHDVGPGERIDITLLLRGLSLPQKSVGDIQQELLLKAQTLLTKLLGD